MGKLVPVLLAVVLKLSEVNLFREESNSGCEPLISSLIFLIALSIILVKVRLYPPSLRKLRGLPAAIWNFLFAVLVLEYGMEYFWYPLEANTIAFLCKIADFERDVLIENGILQLLRTNIAAVITSYALSVFFLYCALNGTRFIDFRKSRCGSMLTWKDVHKLQSKFMKSLGLKQGNKGDCCKCKKRRPVAESYSDNEFSDESVPSDC